MLCLVCVWGEGDFQKKFLMAKLGSSGVGADRYRGSSYFFFLIPLFTIIVWFQDCNFGGLWVLKAFDVILIYFVVVKTFDELLI